MNNNFNDLNNKFLDWLYDNQILLSTFLLCMIGYIMAIIFFSYINKNKAEEFYLNWSLEEHRYMDPVSKAQFIEKEKKKHYKIMFVLIPFLSFYMKAFMDGYFIVCLLSFFFFFGAVYTLYVGSFKWQNWKSKKK